MTKQPEKRIPAEVVQLAAEFLSEATARRNLGDQNAEYHARQPKIDAHKLLLAVGFTPKAVVVAFREVCMSLGTRCVCDDSGDSPCPIHAAEMRAQDQRIARANKS